MFGPAISVAGCRIDPVDRATALRVMAGFCREEWPHLVVTADSSMLVMAQTDPELREIMERADLVVPDSIGVIWASRLFGTPLRERVAGVEMMEQLCAHCRDAGLSIFLLGAARGIAERAAAQLQGAYPGLNVAGTHHGYFNEAEELEVITKISSTRPDVLFAALGIPRQEKWLSRRLHRLPIRLAMGVGGSLDVMAGEVKRAPVLFRRLNLEWLYRVVTNPGRYRKTLALPRFVWLAFQYRFLGRTLPRSD